MTIFLQIVILIVTFSAVMAIIRKKWVIVIVSVLFSLFITLQFVSYFLVNSLIDYRFYEHINLKDIWSVRGFYASEILWGTISFIVLSIVFYLLFLFFRTKRIIRWIPLTIVLAGILAMTIPSESIGSNLYNIYAIKGAEQKSFDSALKALNIDPATYIKATEITAEPGKNIVVISLESLELGFLQPPLEKLTPNLRRLSKEFSFYEMNENQGSNWTEASIYTSLTGIPAFFRSERNSTFQNASTTNIGNLGKVLEVAGYDMTFMLAKKNFSGLNNMLIPFGFNVKSHEDLGVPRNDGFWGLHDKELFEEATKEIIQKSKGDKPFALFLNTISGHFPTGVYDARMEGVFPEQRSKLEFMTYAVDHYIGELFKALEKENLLESTVVYIYPDHKFMGRLDKVIKDFPEQRDLFLISTAPTNTLEFDPSKPLTQIDIPRIILNGAEIKSNVTFLTDYLKDTDKQKFINKNVTNFLALNAPSVNNFDYKNQIKLTLSEDNILTISQEDGHGNAFPNITQESLYRIYFDENMQLIKCNKVTDRDAFWRGNTAGIIFSVRENMLYTYLLKGKKIGVARKGANEVIFNKNDLDIFEEWTILKPPKEFKPNTLYLKSVGYNAANFRGPSYIKTGLEDHVLKRGLNVLTTEENVYVVENFDTYENSEDTKEFIQKVRILLENKTPFAVVADDSAFGTISDYEDELEALGFLELQDIENRDAYVGYLGENGYVIEELDQSSVSVELPLRIFHKTTNEELRKDRTRFIAHGGGKIDNKIYTNSREALNFNYAKGFRYFELDIIEAADHKYVAAHDWDSWVKRTGYTGSIPPTTEQFLATKVDNKYTTMDIQAINSWFKAHPDATLVTDKINDPVNFAKAFIDKDRLMMELFSVEAIVKANALDLKGVLASNNIVRKFKGEEIAKFKELDIKYLAVSRKFVSENKALFLALKAEGFITYVFHINYEKGKDEEYVYKYELGLVHGMYADNWTFTDENIALPSKGED